MTEGINWLLLGDGPSMAAEESSHSDRPSLTLLPNPVAFRVLGQLEVLRGGEPVELGGHRQRIVVAVLVMNARRVVSFDRLVDALWGEEPPAGAKATVHAYVSKLRRLLEPDRRPGAKGSVIGTRSCGYVLDVDPETIDARRFERLSAEGRVALAAGKAEAAVELFTEALSLWQGPALADFTFEAFAATDIARLEELRLSVTEDRFEAALSLGRHREVVADLEPLTAAHPFRERLRAQLMVALYRCGRQAEALRAYQLCRAMLAEELGIDPSPALRALEAAVLRQDPSLEWAPPTSGTETLVPAPSRKPATKVSGPPVETVTFLLSEVEGVSRLSPADHPTGAAGLVARHQELVGQAVLTHGGTLSEESGDGSVLAVFSRAGEALAAALALQRALATESWPKGVTVDVRIGLQTRHVTDGQRLRGRKSRRRREVLRPALGVA
jgi:DNA-binding SARP family transcriptional activator